MLPSGAGYRAWAASWTSTPTAGTGTWRSGTGCHIRIRPPDSVQKARLPAFLDGSTARDEHALSQVHATILMVAITIILALLILIMVLGMIPSWSWANPSDSDPLPPIIIIGIDHTSAKTGSVTYASRVFLLNNGSTVYTNNDLMADFYRDRWKLATVSTLNGYLLIKSNHYQVRFIKGEGCRSRYWNPGEIMEVDLKDGKITPGTNVTVKVIDKRTKKVISTHTVVA
ncbi:MAG: archaellin/type IV pilin N-terminal domain-containing protein [Methanoculleus sp.]